MSWTDKTKSLLQEIIRCKAVNPSSNEEKVAKLINSKLKRAGIETYLLHPKEHDTRLSLIARIPGRNPKAAKIGLMGHLDVVPVNNPKKWKYPPFSGVEAEGFIWGRGAFDCGVTVASEVMAMIRLAQEEFKPEGDIILIAAADEEAGGDYGVKFLINKHWEKVAVDYLINEGGGPPMLKNDNLTQYSFCSSEKGPFWSRLIIRGEPGHSSIPLNERNAIITASEIIKRLSSHKPEIRITPVFKAFVDGYGLPGLLKSKLAYKILYPLLKKVIPEKTAFIDAMIRMTFAPTVIETIEGKANIIPDQIQLTVDSRIVPGQSLVEAKDEYKKALKDLWNKIEFQPILQNKGNESKLDTPLYDSINRVMKKIDKKSTLVPFISAGTTDSRFWREKGTIAYGFTPTTAFLPVTEISDLAHNINERIDIGTIALQHRFMYEIVKEFQSEAKKKIV